VTRAISAISGDEDNLVLKALRNVRVNFSWGVNTDRAMRRVFIRRNVATFLRDSIHVRVLFNIRLLKFFREKFAL